jgi:hypothetical protein
MRFLRNCWIGNLGICLDKTSPNTPWSVPHRRIGRTRVQPKWGCCWILQRLKPIKALDIRQFKTLETTFDVMFHESMDLVPTNNARCKINAFAQPPCLVPYKHLEGARSPQADEHNFEFFVEDHVPLSLTGVSHLHPGPGLFGWAKPGVVHPVATILIEGNRDTPR